MMRISEQLRKFIFWTLDFIKGSKIKRHYSAIKSHMECIDLLKVKKDQETLLVRLLNHAVETTTFYKEYKTTSITDFPVVNKELIKKNTTGFQSRRYSHKKQFSVATSGSTGASFIVQQDYNKRYRNVADILYFSELAGFQLGYRLFYLRFWSMFQKKNRLQSFFQNICPIDVFDLSPDMIQRIILRLQKDKSNKGMLGYASSFDKICNYLASKNAAQIKCNLRSVIGISERLNPKTKEMMAKYFGVQMVSRYSNAENGMIAQQPLGKEYFKINTASYFVEILHFNQNTRMRHGELGRIVITDLFNYNTPIIRYDTGDIGIMDTVQEHSGARLVLKKVEGRKMDMIRNTSGEILSTSILLLINKYEEVLERQIIQKTHNQYVFKLKLKDQAFERETVFKDEFKGYLGEDAIITIEYVTAIPLLASGKQQAIINEVGMDT